MGKMKDFEMQAVMLLSNKLFLDYMECRRHSGIILSPEDYYDSWMRQTVTQVDIEFRKAVFAEFLDKLRASNKGRV